MAKRKVRNYPSVEHVEELVNNYFDEHKEEVIDYMISETNRELGKDFKDLDDLHDFEFGSGCGGFGLDCGWVWLYAKNKDQRHEWFLDNDRIPNYASPHNWPYHTQSTTLKQYQMKKAIDDLNLSNDYMVYTKLD